MMHPTTSDMRIALCAAICTTVYSGTSDQKRRLADELDAMPFERMSDAALITTAQTFCGPERTAQIIGTKSAVRREIRETYLCAACHDQHVIEVEAGRWGPCRACGIVVEVDA